MSFTTCRISAPRWSRIAGSGARCLRSATRATCRRRWIALGFTPRALSGSALTGRCIPLTAPSAAPTRATGQRDAVAIAQRDGAGGDDFVAVFQATEDLDNRTLLGSHLHRAEHGRFVLQLKDRATTTEVDDGSRRPHERVLLGLCRAPHAGAHPGLEAERGIRDLDLDRCCARGGIQNGRYARDAAGELLAGKRVDLDARIVTALEFLQILFDDVRDQ